MFFNINTFCYYRYLTLTVILLKVPLCEYTYITHLPFFFASTLPEALTAAMAGKNYINLSWTKVKGVSGYIIYGNRCNSNGKVYPLRKVISTAKMSQKIMKLKKGTYYKYVVIAYKMTGAGQKVIASSKTINVVNKAPEAIGKIISMVN